MPSRFLSHVRNPRLSRAASKDGRLLQQSGRRPRSTPVARLGFSEGAASERCRGGGVSNLQIFSLLVEWLLSDASARRRPTKNNTFGVPVKFVVFMCCRINWEGCFFGIHTNKRRQMDLMGRDLKGRCKSNMGCFRGWDCGNAEEGRLYGERCLFPRVRIGRAPGMNIQIKLFDIHFGCSRNSLPSNLGVRGSGAALEHFMRSKVDRYWSTDLVPSVAANVVCLFLFVSQFAL